MSDKYLARPLRAMDSIYRFEGGMNQSGRVATGQDITVVHNVSREAALSSAPAQRKAGAGNIFGFVRFSLGLVHAAPGTLFSAITDIYQVEASFLGVPKSEIWIWLYNLQCSISDTADFDTAALAIGDLTLGSNVTSLLRSWGTAEASSFASGGTFLNVRPLGEAEPLPFLAREDDDILAYSVSDTGGTITVNVFGDLYIGPRFTDPPLR